MVPGRIALNELYFDQNENEPTRHEVTFLSSGSSMKGSYYILVGGTLYLYMKYHLITSNHHVVHHLDQLPISSYFMLCFSSFLSAKIKNPKTSPKQNTKKGKQRFIHGKTSQKRNLIYGTTNKTKKTSHFSAKDTQKMTISEIRRWQLLRFNAKMTFGASKGKSRAVVAFWGGMSAVFGCGVWSKVKIQDFKDFCLVP